MEVIAGDEDFEAVVVQQGCRFHLNFAQVYWNSRLEAEHSRLVERWFKVRPAMPTTLPSLVAKGHPGASFNP